MNGGWFSLKWKAHASTKKENAKNGRSILLTIPTERCLASYSSSAESVKNSRHGILGIREIFFLHLPEVNRKTRNENSQQILENIGYGLGVTP